VWASSGCTSKRLPYHWCDVGTQEMDGYLSSTWLWSHFTSSGSATSILFSRNSTVYFCFYRTWYVYTDAHRIVQMRKQHSDIQGIEPHYQRELAYPVDVNKTLRMFKGISHHHCVVSQWIVKINGIILLWYLIIIQYRTWRISPHCFCAIHQTSTQEFGPDNLLTGGIGAWGITTKSRLV